MLAVIKFKNQHRLPSALLDSGNDPATHSGQWDAWQILGQCDGGANNPPQVFIQSPLNNAKIPQGSVVGLQANASDSDGSITQVEFLVGTQRIAIDQQAHIKWTGRQHWVQRQ